MTQYKIFRHPSSQSEAVKQGWSWPGFFFGFIWAMVKKMWGLGVGVLIGFMVFSVIIGIVAGDEAGEALINVGAIIVSIVFGMNGNSWREKSLLSRGYEHEDTVTAANPEGAMALYLKAATAAK